MAVERLQPGVVLDDDVVAVPDQGTAGIGHRAGEHHRAVGRGEDRCSQRNGEIETGMEMREPGVGRLEDVGGRAKSLGDGGVGDRPEQFAGHAQHRVFRDRLRGAREVLQGKDRLLDLAEDAVRLQRNQLGPPGRHRR